MSKKIVLSALLKSESSRTYFHAAPNDTAKTMPPEQMFYRADDGATVVLPVVNIEKSVYSERARSCAAKLITDLRKYKTLGTAFQNYVRIRPLREHSTTITYNNGPVAIPFLRDGKPVLFGGRWNKDTEPWTDPVSGMTVHARSVPAPDGSRIGLTYTPYLPAPWELRFNVEFRPNDQIDQETVEELLVVAGELVGIGTWRTGGNGRFMFSCERIA